MAEAQSLRQVAQSRAPLSAWLGILLLFMLFGVIVLAVVGPSVRTDQYEQTRAKKRADILKGLREEDAKTLTSYSWVDKAKGSAHIPIERAMRLTMAELAQKKPAAAYPIATPPPAPAAPAAAATNPPGAKPATPPVAASTPPAAPAPPSAKPAASPPGPPNQSAPGTPLPVAGKSPTP